MRVVFSAVESEGGLDGVRVAGGRAPRDHFSDNRPCSAAIPACGFAVGQTFRFMLMQHRHVSKRASSKKMVLLLVPRPPVFLPTGKMKLRPFDLGKPDRFDQLSEKIGQIQISNKNGSSIGFHRLADRFGR